MLNVRINQRCGVFKRSFTINVLTGVYVLKNIILYYIERVRLNC